MILDYSQGLEIHKMAILTDNKNTVRSTDIPVNRIGLLTIACDC